jgi:hypothetical protein
MSNDGNRMVIGANYDDTPGSNAGSVEVYEYSSGSWTKMGSTINGEAAGDQFGSAVSMNGAGTRIVVGAYFNDGNGSQIQDMQESLIGMVLHGHKLEQILMERQLVMNLDGLFP